SPKKTQKTKPLKKIPETDGGILDSVEAALHWAANMTWKGLKPIIHLVNTTYERGIKVLPDELDPYKSFWLRSETLPKWDITIVPPEW
ncbi:MAG: ISAzo13-like element transposase-related protein, partial [Prochlorotrichaceae cyanobacterium]